MKGGQSPLFKERREHPRFRLYRLMQVVDPKTGVPFKVNATLSNISEGGLCFYGDQMLRPLAKVRILIDIPEFNSQADLAAKVAWVQRSTEHVGSVMIGVRFMRVKENERRLIKRLTNMGTKERL